MSNDFIEKISKKISSDYEKLDKIARSSLFVLVCGSYKEEEDKKIILEMVKNIRKKGISGCITMEDVPSTTGMNPVLKFKMIWNEMKKGNPLFIMFAGNSSERSTGLNAEIQTVVTDLEKRSCAFLITYPDVTLTGFSKGMANYHIVETSSQAIEKAEDIVERKIEEIKMFLQSESDSK